MMGGESAGPGVTFAPRPPTVILMAGLQGSGKTTADGQARPLLRTEHHSSVAVAACDVYRPAAVEQLVQVGAAGAARPSTSRAPTAIPVEIARVGAGARAQEGKDVLIVDTSGRLHVDGELMAELVAIRDAVKPDAGAARASTR